MNAHYEISGTSYIWNAAKAQANFDKHEVSFERATRVFFDPFLVLTDARRNDEARDAVIGFDETTDCSL